MPFICRCNQSICRSDQSLDFLIHVWEFYFTSFLLFLSLIRSRLSFCSISRELKRRQGYFTMLLYGIMRETQPFEAPFETNTELPDYVFLIALGMLRNMEMLGAQINFLLFSRQFRKLF